MTIQKIAAVVDVLQNTQNFVISRCCFCSGRKKVKRFKTHEQNNAGSAHLTFYLATFSQASRLCFAKAPWCTRGRLYTKGIWLTRANRQTESGQHTINSSIHTVDTESRIAFSDLSGFNISYSLNGIQSWILRQSQRYSFQGVTECSHGILLQCGYLRK